MSIENEIANRENSGISIGSPTEKVDNHTNDNTNVDDSVNNIKDNVSDNGNNEPIEQEVVSKDNSLNPNEENNIETEKIGSGENDENEGIDKLSVLNEMFGTNYEDIDTVKNVFAKATSNEVDINNFNKRLGTEFKNLNDVRDAINKGFENPFANDTVKEINEAVKRGLDVNTFLQIKNVDSMKPEEIVALSMKMKDSEIDVNDYMASLRERYIDEDGKIDYELREKAINAKEQLKKAIEGIVPDSNQIAAQKAIIEQQNAQYVRDWSIRYDAVMADILQQGIPILGDNNEVLLKYNLSKEYTDKLREQMQIELERNPMPYSQESMNTMLGHVYNTIVLENLKDIIKSNTNATNNKVTENVIQKTHNPSKAQKQNTDNSNQKSTIQTHNEETDSKVKSYYGL